MATITIKTPFKGRGIKVIWEGGKVRVRGTSDELLYWSNLKSDGMYGMYGHTINFQNTPISDLIVALQNRVPDSDLILDDEAKETRKMEGKAAKPFPKGAVS